MPQHILEKRMENLEKTVAGLAELPAQMRDLSSQFLLLRQDVRADISALDLRVDGLAGDVRQMRDELRADMAAMHTELAGAILANGVEMRTLHEDLVKRITLLGEARRD